MRLEAKKYLHDIQTAAGLIAEFTLGLSFAGYRENAMVRAAVEREFEIIGEALAQLAKFDEGVASQITDRRRIVALRNILIHGYSIVDDRLVWDVVESKLPKLRAEVEALLTAD
jgi:uncharacterized protein with HEPN domain